MADRRSEKDYFAPQTFGTAIRWLEENASRDRFFLHIDTFDPHEPWDPPARYVDLYDPGYTGEAVIYPRYGSTDVLSDTEFAPLPRAVCRRSDNGGPLGSGSCCK